MIRVLGYQNLSQKSGSGDALVDHLRGYRSLDQSLTLFADPFAPDVTLYGKRARDVIQLLADVLANTLELAATLAQSVVRFVVDQGARQFRGQCLAFGFLPGASRLLFLTPCLFKLGLDRRQVTVDQFIQQLPLNCIELFTASSVFVTLENGQFVSQLLDDRMAVHQRPLLSAQGFILGLQDVHQFRRQGTELIGRKLVEIGALSHARQYAKSGDCVRFAVRIMAILQGLWLQDGDHALSAKALPGQALNQSG